MNNTIESPDHSNGILFAVLIAVIIYGMHAPAYASQSPLLDFIPQNTLSPYAIAREMRMLAVANARIALAKATSAGGEKAAPYEYYMAVEYFKLAEEELSSGDNIGVGKFSREAEKYSFTVIDKVEGGSQ
jgi:hypothetical protein